MMRNLEKIVVQNSVGDFIFFENDDLIEKNIEFFFNRGKWTGYKDIYKNKIYEGDTLYFVVLSPSKKILTGKVYWCNQTCSWRILSGSNKYSLVLNYKYSYLVNNGNEVFAEEKKKILKIKNSQ
ncbi:MAG: hypothetical protein EOM23_03405 [Candidatus Moranbacteria bacterium]|nr:hypothetical protein [Candidatus Moranbacteria bacterium]